jgi:hypothetical protein
MKPAASKVGLVLIRQMFSQNNSLGLRGLAYGVTAIRPETPLLSKRFGM